MRNGGPAELCRLNDQTLCSLPHAAPRCRFLGYTPWGSILEDSFLGTPTAQEERPIDTDI